MEQAIVRRLKAGTLESYRAVAREKGTSLEAELREVIERHRPARRKDPARLLELSRYHQSMTPEGARLTDSSDFIRWDRDTQHGKWEDDAGSNDDAGH